MTQNQNEDTKMHIPEGYTEKPVSHNGLVLAILIIILLVLLGGLYLWGSVLREQGRVPAPEIINNEPETPRANADVEILNTMSPSDEIEAIEADIINTDLDSLTTDLITIDAEITAIFAE